MFYFESYENGVLSHALTVKYLNSDLDHVSGNFPETAWRCMNCRQAAHAILLVSRFSP